MVDPLSCGVAAAAGLISDTPPYGERHFANVATIGLRSSARVFARLRARIGDPGAARRRPFGNLCATSPLAPRAVRRGRGATWRPMHASRWATVFASFAAIGCAGDDSNPSAPSTTDASVSDSSRSGTPRARRAERRRETAAAADRARPRRELVARLSGDRLLLRAARQLGVSRGPSWPQRGRRWTPARRSSCTRASARTSRCRRATTTRARRRRSDRLQRRHRSGSHLARAPGRRQLPRPWRSSAARSTEQAARRSSQLAGFMDDGLATGKVALRFYQRRRLDGSARDFGKGTAIRN